MSGGLTQQLAPIAMGIRPDLRPQIAAVVQSQTYRQATLLTLARFNFILHADVVRRIFDAVELQDFLRLLSPEYHDTFTKFVDAITADVLDYVTSRKVG